MFLCSKPCSRGSKKDSPSTDVGSVFVVGSVGTVSVDGGVVVADVSVAAAAAAATSTTTTSAAVGGDCVASTDAFVSSLATLPSVCSTAATAAAALSDGASAVLSGCSALASTINAASLRSAARLTTDASSAMMAKRRSEIIIRNSMMGWMLGWVGRDLNER